MNNLVPIKNCLGGGGVHGNLNWMVIVFHFVFPFFITFFRVDLTAKLLTFL